MSLPRGMSVSRPKRGVEGWCRGGGVSRFGVEVWCRGLVSLSSLGALRPWLRESFHAGTCRTVFGDASEKALGRGFPRKGSGADRRLHVRVRSPAAWRVR